MSECRKEGKKKNKGDIVLLAKSFTCVALTVRVSGWPEQSKNKILNSLLPPQMVKKENSSRLCTTKGVDIKASLLFVKISRIFQRSRCE